MTRYPIKYVLKTTLCIHSANLPIVEILTYRKSVMQSKICNSFYTNELLAAPIKGLCIIYVW